LAVMEPQLVPGGVEEVGPETVRITTLAPEVKAGGSRQQEAGASEPKVEHLALGQVRALIHQKAADYAREASRRLGGASVQIVKELGAQTSGETFEIITTETDTKIVRDAILAVMSDKLNIEGQVNFAVRTDPGLAPDGLFPVEQRRLAAVINDESAVGDVRDYLGGVAIVLDQLDPPQSEQQIRRRLPDFEQYAWRDFEVIGLKSAGGADNPERRYSSVAVVVADPNFSFDEDEAAWRQNLAGPEMALARGALLSERSLQKVTQFGKQVATQAQNQAAMALVFALLAITIYIWVRFGTLRFGLGAVVALGHDVSVQLGAVAVAYFLSLTPIGKLLGIGDFKIDLTMIAAILTLIGYSVNDTIVVFDRIRENRGKLTSVSAALVNASINQTLSRTLLTSLTVVFVLAVLYVAGGQGIHGMSYALLVGMVVGTYSSIAIASPLLLTRARAGSAAG
jgi:SecD/SecF fusion protein